MEKIKVALSGQGAEKNLSKQMVAFIKDQYREIHTHKKNYNQWIREKVQTYYGVSISSEATRQIFANDARIVILPHSDAQFEIGTNKRI